MAKKKVVFSIEERDLKNIKRIAVETDKELQELYLEGVNYVLVKYKQYIKQ